MIDLHLLLRISRDDVDFRKKVMSKIEFNAEQFSAAFEAAIRLDKWNNCFYLLQGFHNQITPYGQLSFLEEMNAVMSVLLYNEQSEAKREACTTILATVREGIAHIHPMAISQAERAS